MSLSKTRRCATCRKTEDQVENMLTCPTCDVMTFCSRLCANIRRKKHRKDCEIIGSHINVDTEFFESMNEALLEIAMVHDNYEALERGVEGIHHGHLHWIAERDQLLRDTPDLICFHIELGKKNLSRNPLSSYSSCLSFQRKH